ncbi:MAG: nickel pincer cofactor biosynthesis protein LarC [Coriobacteriia bacterium]|nr:nickel pincer cofactor biosynthesis protein LarC [Coriobacteriia bacterium]
MILHFDFSTGAAGDKILGSLIEVSESLGLASFEDVQEVGSALVPKVAITRSSLKQGGIQATGITVDEDSPSHRHWSDIRAQITEAGERGVLSERALQLSLDAFGAIAVAEAQAHGVDIEEVHFHEIGAADTIIDICCNCFLLDRLDPEAVYATPLALGSGTFVCSHGELPVPPPATVLLIEGLPAYAGSHQGELTTPTGATLARTFVTNWEQLPCMKPQAVGYGAGTRTIPGAANVVRAIMGERVSLAGLMPSMDCVLEGCTLLESNIDHLSPEALAFACEQLLAFGALDVWLDPIAMKKGRMAVRLNALAYAHETQHTAEKIIALTGSLGVRSHYVERTCVPREIITKETGFGEVRYKAAFVSTPEGSVKLQRPEYEDVARIAREQGLDFNRLYEELCEELGE